MPAINHSITFPYGFKYAKKEVFVNGDLAQMEILPVAGGNLHAVLKTKMFAPSGYAELVLSCNGRTILEMSADLSLPASKRGFYEGNDDPSSAFDYMLIHFNT